MAKASKKGQKSNDWTLELYNQVRLEETKESDVQSRMVKIFRRLPDCLVQKVKNEDMYRFMSDEKKAHAKRSKDVAEGLIVGASDLILVLGQRYWSVYPNCILFVEVKRFGEKPRETQLMYAEKVRSLGFVYVALDNTDQAHNLFNLINERRPLPEVVTSEKGVPNYRKNLPVSGLPGSTVLRSMIKEALYKFGKFLGVEDKKITDYIENVLGI